jgi:hypothetical protein
MSRDGLDDAGVVLGWGHWYHVTFGTYGHWLPGDERGWCERNHRRHVPGTAARPPARNKWTDGLLKYSKKVMKRPAFLFEPADFEVIASHFFESLAIQKASVACLSVGNVHCHLLVRCEDDRPKHCAGDLKTHVYHRMFRGRATPWEKGSHEDPIADLAHGRRVFNYIMKHVEEGAWVWGFRDLGGWDVARAHKPQPRGGGGFRDHADWAWVGRRVDSMRSSWAAKWGSDWRESVMVRMACMTVVWSRPPK